MIAGLLLLLPARQQPAEAEHVAPPPLFELDSAPFAGVPVPKQGEAFTVLAGDADHDGDPDLLVNWHVYAPPALLTNEGGRFRPDPRGWSLPELPLVPLLDAVRKPMLAAFRAHARPGVTLWHSDRASFWFVALQGPFGKDGEVPTLVVEANLPILALSGPGKDLCELRDERVLRIPLSAAAAGQHVFFATHDVAVQIRAHVEGAELPFFLGPELVEQVGPVELWGRDPHGLAWLDATGDRRPDLAVVRGALHGLLVPPLEPKFDALYLARAGASVGFERVELPRDYGRGRMVQWVDVDGDGRLELYVGNKASPNTLLRFDAEMRHAKDAAPALGLDFAGADAFAWFDLDGDGDDDLVTLDAASGFGLLRSTGGRSFERLDAAAHGLELARSGLSDEEAEPVGGTESPDGDPIEPVAAPAPVIDQHDLQLLDFDDDGDLDLLVSAWGRTAACVLFAAEGEHFVDATERAGLAGAQGTTQAIALDFDADGWLDLLCLGPVPELFHNEHGRFVALPLGPEWRGAGRVGTACDADGDGRFDAVVAGRELQLARNCASQRGAWVTLTVERDGRVPVGAVVRAFHADGAVCAFRVGSTQRGHLSQGHGPLALASPPENPLRRIEVSFPDGKRLAREVTAPGPISIAAEGPSGSR